METRNTRALFFFIIFFSLCLSLSIPWDETKTISTSNFELTSAKSFSTCDLAPDGSDLLDNCTVVFLVKNKWKSLSLSDSSFNLQWLKTVSNAQFVYYKTYSIQEVKDCFADEEQTCFLRSVLILGEELPLSSLSSSVGDVTAVGVKFRKSRWSSTAFNVTVAGLTKLDPDIGVCGTLGTANSIYTLNTSLPSVTLTCFNVTADNITLDCQGYTIYYGAFLNSFAIWARNVNNFTMKNCNIYQNGSAGSHAVYLAYSNYSNIINNSNITTTGNSDYNLIGTYIANTTIDNNTLLVVSNASQRNIYLTGSNGTNITRNIFWVNGSSAIGLNLAFANQYGANYIVAHNTFYSVNISSRCLYVNSPYTVVFNNTCFYLSGSPIRGVEVIGAQTGWSTDFVNVSNNHIYTNQSSANGLGIYYSHYVTIDSNDIWVSGTSSFGISMSNTTNITISNNLINANNTTGRGLFVAGNNSNVNISNCTFNVSRNGVMVGFSSAENSYANNTNISVWGGSIQCLTACGSYSDVFVNQSSDLTMVNVSWNRTNYTMGTWTENGENNLTVKWFIQVNASNNLTLAAIASAWVNVTDNNSVNVTNESTDASGLTQWRLFTDYFITSAGGESATPSTNYSYYNNLHFIVNATGFDLNETYLNITSSQTILLLLYAPLPIYSLVIISIDVYPSVYKATFVIVTNATANITIELSRYASLNESTNYSSNTFLLSTSVLAEPLNHSEVYYYRVYAVNTTGVRSIVYAFTTLFTQTITPPANKGMELTILLLVLALSIGVSIYAFIRKDVFLLIVAAALNLIAGNYVYQGTYLILKSNSLVFLTYSNFYLQSVGLSLVFITFYLMFEAFRNLAAFITARREHEDEE